VKNKPLTKKQRNEINKKLPEWQLIKKDTTIKRVFETPSYVDGLVLIARIAVHAEILQHHPDILFQYSQVTVILTTHDQKALTQKDCELAHRIDTLFSKSPV